MLNQVKELNPDIICICSLSPSAVSKARYSLTRIQARFQNIQVLVGLWLTREGLEKAKERLESTGKGKLLIASSQQALMENLCCFYISWDFCGKPFLIYKEGN